MTHFAYDIKDSFLDDAEFMKWFREVCEEYLTVRPYFDGDMYPLTSSSLSNDVWSAVQWDRPENSDGMLQIFRREKSSYTNAVFVLRNIDAEKTYLFTDIDGGEFTVSGKELSEKGFCVEIKDRPCAKIYFYKQIN